MPGSGLGNCFVGVYSGLGEDFSCGFRYQWMRSVIAESRRKSPPSVSRLSSMRDEWGMR